MRNKIVLVFHNINGDVSEETVWVLPYGDYYKIDNVPFYAPNLAFNDLVSVEMDEGVMYFDSLIQPSGHSTLQIIFFNKDEMDRVIKKIESLGCNWEGMKNKPYFAVDVPPELDYKVIKALLDYEADKNVLDYKEACLAENHL